MTTDGITVVVAVNDDEVLGRNLLRSPDLAGEMHHQLLLKRGYASASLAYNSALADAHHDVVLFVHQDVYLPTGWFDSARRAMAFLDASGSRWGVLGSFGSSRTVFGGLGCVFTTGKGVHGNALTVPTPAETLDEIVLILRKSSGLRFDDGLPHFHLYGSDICLQARRRGLVSYAIPAPCVHNTNQLLQLPAEFYECYHYMKRKWYRELPIYTSCMTVSRLDAQLRKRQLRDTLDRFASRPRAPQRRIEDPTVALAALRALQAR